MSSNNNNNDIQPLSREERKALLLEQLINWTTKVKDEIDKNDLPNRITYIVQYASAVFQYARALQKNIRGEDEDSSPQQESEPQQ